MTMTDEQLLRYSRHIMLEGFDVEGQQRLLQARVLIVGLGGLGCPVALYLAAAGVGELWLADFDAVELSNLQRQIAHRIADVDRPKVVSAAEAARALNPDLVTECISDKLTGELMRAAVERADVVVDATDNFSTRFELNRCCVELGTPLVSGAAIRCEGQVIVFDPRREESPCYRCLYEDSGDQAMSCADSGVLAPLVGIIGSVQALETVKLLSGYGDVTPGQLSVLDGRSLQWRSLRLPRRPDCPVCATRGG